MQKNPSRPLNSRVRFITMNRMVFNDLLDYFHARSGLQSCLSSYRWCIVADSFAAVYEGETQVCNLFETNREVTSLRCLEQLLQHLPPTVRTLRGQNQFHPSGVTG
jgi:hypothetical protein